MSAFRLSCGAWLALSLAAVAPARAAADGPSSQVFDAQGVKIHYLEQGTGPPVVLIHGLHASAELNWNLPGILGALAKDHRVIALDLPGHGRSDKPQEEAAYGLRLVEDVVLLMDHLKIDKAHVVGYSLGGMVTLKLLVEHPDRVLSGTLGGMGWLREGSPLQRIWERFPAREGGRTPPAMIRSIGELAVGRDELLKIGVPVKVLIGDRDPCKRMYVEPLQEVRKDWPVVEIRDAGHLGCVVKPQFREALVEWLKAPK